MKKQIISGFVLFFVYATLNGQTTVNSTGGGDLQPAVRAVIGTAELSTVTNLIVTGTMDATDFRFIRDSLRALQSLDLSGVNIVAYSGQLGTNFNPFNGNNMSFDYGADTVPVWALYKRYQSGSIINPITVEVAMTNLTSFILPNSAKAIGDNAVCKTQVATIDLSNMTDLERVGDEAFSRNSLLKKIIFPSSSMTHIGSGVVSSCPILDTFNIPGTVATLGIGANFFAGCKALAAVNFEEPAHVESLPATMFGAPSSDLTPDALLYVKVPSSVTNVGAAFDKFNGTYIDCDPGNLTYEGIGGVLYLRSDGSIVAAPKGLTSLTLPATITEIADNLFDGGNLTSVTILGNLTKIGNRAFYGCPLTSFDFQSSLVEIGNHAFANTKLTAVSFPNHANLQTLGDAIFSDVKTLQTADLSGLTVLGSAMFRSCSALSNLTLGTSLTKIPANAFATCSALTTVSIPNTVDSIMQNAFAECSNLANVNLPTSLKYLGGVAFSNDTAIASMTIPATCEEIALYTYGGTAFSGTYINVNVDAGNPNYASHNGMLLNKQKTKLYYMPNSNSKKSVAVPEGVDTIVAYTLYTNQNNMIEKLTLPSTLKYIANNGLYGAANVDTIIVKAVTPPYCGGGYALNNSYSYRTKRVIIPARAKPLYTTANVWKNFSDSIYVMEGKFFNMGSGITNAVSPNGQYAVGNELNQAYILDILTNTLTPIAGATEGRAVNDSAQTVVLFADTDYMVNGTPLQNCGVYRDGTIYSTGLGRFGEVATSAGVRTDIVAIDAAGNVYGATMERNNFAKIAPFAWKFNGVDYKTDTMAYGYPWSQGDQGAKILSVSADGQIASGWVSRVNYGGQRQPIAWTNPTTYKLFNKEKSGDAAGVSPNGKYIALQHERHASIYDVAADKLTVFGPEESFASAVSDNGFVIGFTESATGRQAFIWSDRLGLMYFRQFIDKYMPTMQMPDEPYFNFPSEGGVYDVPMSISADGLTICGWSGFNPLERRGWIMMIPDTLDLVDRPHDVSAIVDIPQRNVVNLSWTAPVDYGTHTLDFYYIYRNGQYIGRVEHYQGTSYTDLNAPSGSVSYQISAVFDYVNTSTYLESAKTDVVKVSVVDNYNLPFAEDFESGSFETNFWTATALPTSGWLTHWYYTGFNSMRSAVFVGGGDQTAYNLSLTSKPLNAASTNKVILAFVYHLSSTAEEFLGQKDTISVEVGVNGVWTTVNQILVDRTIEWSPATFDISDIAAGHLFQVRIRASSGANRNAYTLFIDDFGVATEEPGTPSGVIAYRVSNIPNSPVRVLYKDVAGSYGLSYTNGVLDMSIGNEGHSIIGVNRYTSKDLHKLKDKYLTSISAFLFADRAGTTIPSQLKLAVFVNGKRVESSNIGSWKGGWNNFPLSTPIKISGDEVLLVGIEAASGDALNRPLSLDVREHVNKDANLYSENNGTTWQNADDAGFVGHWGIKANIRDEAVAATPDDDLLGVRYEIYRNNVKIKTLNYGQLYLDSAATANDDCYSVAVFRSLGGMSQISSAGCTEVVAVAKIEAVENEDPIYVYPNPTSTVVNIVADNYKLVRVLNMQGQEVQRQSAGSQVDLYKQPNGMYLLEITTRDNRTQTVKVIKK